MRKFWSCCIVVWFLLGTASSPAFSQPDDCLNANGDSRFGVVAHLGWEFLYPPDVMAQALDIMQAAGIGWVRLNWAWKDLQPQPGNFHFEHYDMIARLTSERDIQLLPILAAVPAWASTAPAELIAERGNLSPVDRYRAADMNDWLTYVRTVVERYDGDGLDDAPGSPRIGFWEIWNEPNIAAFWLPAPDVEEYFDLLAATHDAIQEADSTAQVVLGGLAGTGIRADGGGFLPDLYALGAASYFDVVSVHLYVYPASGVYPAPGAVAQVQDMLADVRAVMNLNGDSGKPIWLTEIGWSDAENAWGHPTVSPEAVAAFLTEVYTSLADADTIFWYNFRNIFDGSPDVEHNFGLLRADLTPKPAFRAYTQITCTDDTNHVRQ